MKGLKKLLFILLLIPISVSALNVQTGDDIKNKEEIDGSSIIAGNNVLEESKIEGINVLIGNNVEFKGNSDYLVTIGNNIIINGNINNDGFVLGNIVKFDKESNINRDLVVYGNEITIDGKINRDIKIYADTVIINSDVQTIDIKANNIEINGKVNKLMYNEDAIITKNDSLINETILTEKLTQEVSFSDKVLNFIYSLGGTLVIFLALYFVTPKLFKKIEKNNENISILNVFSLFGFGALTLILVPAIFLVLLTLIFGLPLALLLLVSYIIAICLANIFTGYLIGHLIWKNIIKKDSNPLLIGLIGISIVNVLLIIPILGILLAVISLVIGIGIILQLFKR